MAGSAGAVAAISTGLADWQHLNGRDRRVGLVHGSVNVTALGLNVLSLSLRGRGRRAAGIAASAAAHACMSVGGYLGGHLVQRRRAAVDHADRSPEPRDFKPVLPLAGLEDGRPRRVGVWDEVNRQEIGIALVRRGDVVHAMGARCSHAGGPLDQGWVLEGTLVCPWHGSRYDLATGQPVPGPSTCPQPRYATRVVDGTVELRREQEPGDQVVTSDSLGRARAAETREGSGGGSGVPGKTATAALFEHHERIRRLFERALATPGTDPRRHGLMRTLASELDIHEVVEDKVFYPAVKPVSEDVEVAYAEHGVLADLVAATVRHPLDSSAFEEHLRALGRTLEHVLDRERTQRFRHAFRELKISLLEGV